MEDVEAYEKGKILKEALKIVDELAKSELADVDGNITNDYFDVESLQKLILRSRKIKQNRWWNLT